MNDPKTAAQHNATQTGEAYSTVKVPLVPLSAAAEAAYAATIADKVRFRPEDVCACGNIGCYDLTTEFLCRTCWQAKSARMQQSFAPIGMLIVDSDRYAAACEKMQGLERERDELRTLLALSGPALANASKLLINHFSNKVCDHEATSECIRCNVMFLIREMGQMQEHLSGANAAFTAATKSRDALREQVTKLREALEYIGGKTDHGHSPHGRCIICATVDKAIAQTEAR